MIKDSISQYVTNGAIFKTKKKYRENSWGPFLLSVLTGVVPGVVLKSFWIYLSISLILIGSLCVALIYIISAKECTLKKNLTMDSIIYSAWVCNISILEFMVFTIWKGLDFRFLLIYIPVIIIPVIAGVNVHKKLESANYEHNKNVSSNIRTTGFLSGILGMNLAAFFRDVDQSTAAIVILICFTILNGFMSLGLLSFQKLYYLNKYDCS